MKCSDQWRSDGRAPRYARRGIERRNGREIALSSGEGGLRSGGRGVVRRGIVPENMVRLRTPLPLPLRSARPRRSLASRADASSFFDKRAVPLFMSGSLLKTPWGMRDITHSPRSFVFQGAVSSPSPVAASCCAMNCITSRWSLVDWRLFFVRMVPVSRRSSSKGSATRPGSSARARS